LSNILYSICKSNIQLTVINKKLAFKHDTTSVVNILATELQCYHALLFYLNMLILGT